MKKNLPFIITMALFIVACVAITVFTIHNEPQYVQVVAETTTIESGHASGDDVVEDDSDNEPVSTQTRINLNTATAEELQVLSGIGPAISERIIEYREEHGYFLYLEEIMEVSGVGEVMFERIREYIYIE